MSKTQQTELTYQRFWTRMEKNSTVVERMPDWMKGSSLNQRTQEPTKAVDQTATARSAPASDR